MGIMLGDAGVSYLVCCSGLKGNNVTESLLEVNQKNSVMVTTLMCVSLAAERQ